MADEKDNGVKPVDTEGEKHAREQLKKASIQGNPEDVAAAAEASKAAEAKDAGEEPEDVDRGRAQLKKKRSYDDMDTAGQDTGDTATGGTKTTHTRKRSRESTAETAEPNGKRKVSGESTREANPKMEEVDRDDMAAGKDKRAATPEPTHREGTEDVAESVASPKTKRSRLHSATEKNGTLETEVPPPAPKPAHAEIPGLEAKKDEASASTAIDDKADEKASKTGSAKIPPTSGFANTSTTSPFGALGGTRSSKSPAPTADPPQTAPSAFAASGFSVLSNSSASGFGAIGKTTGGFGSGGSFATKSPPLDAAKENDKPTSATSTFGGALGQKSIFPTPSTETSAFGGSSASGFGKLGLSNTGGSAFGGLGGSGGLSSFASGKPSTSTSFKAPATSFKAAKPFGAPVDDDEEEKSENGGDEEAGAVTKSPIATDDEPKDERFYEQDVETGEEDEEKLYDCRAKIYTWTTVAQDPNDDKEKPATAKKEWRERGFGILRLNLRVPKDEDGGEVKPKARFLLRAMGSHRVVLNTPVKKELTFGTPQGDKPSGGQVFLMGTIEGSTGLELLQLKVSSPFISTMCYLSLLTPVLQDETAIRHGALRYHPGVEEGPLKSVWSTAKGVTRAFSALTQCFGANKSRNIDRWSISRYRGSQRCKWSSEGDYRGWANEWHDIVAVAGHRVAYRTAQEHSVYTPTAVA